MKTSWSEPASKKDWIAVVIAVCVLSALKAIDPLLGWSVGLLALGWCLGRTYEAGR